MPSPNVSGTIGSLLSFYKHEKRIFGRCPHCREPFRLSEVKLSYGAEPPRDLLTRLKAERDRLLEREGELGDQIEELETEHQAKIEDIETEHQAAVDSLEADRSYDIDALNEKWTDKISYEVDRQLGKERKDIRRKAIAKSRAGQLGKTLEKVAPIFTGFGHHPYDVRPMFDPIDFVVFDGYFQKEVTDITFVEFKTGHKRLSAIQSSIRETVERKRVHFEVRHLSKEAIHMITSGKRAELELLE